jgi:hypothetical protein
MKMNRGFHKIAFSAIALAFALAGCATGPTFSSPEAAPAGRAQLYVYRPLVLAGGGVVHQITIDGKPETLSLPNSSWQRVLLAPGAHTVSIKDFFSIMPCGSLRIDLTPGQTAYVANVVKTTPGLGNLSISCSVAAVPQEQALKEMAGLRGA